MALRSLIFVSLAALALFACQSSKESIMDEQSKKELQERLERFENRKKYTSLDEETLKGIKDEDLEQAIMDYLYYKIGDDYRREYEIITGMLKRIVLCEDWKGACRSVGRDSSGAKLESTSGSRRSASQGGIGGAPVESSWF